MGIEIGLEHSNPIDVGVNMMIRAGFIKIHLRLPHMDGIALFKGERAFVTEMENNAKEIGKVEKSSNSLPKQRTSVSKETPSMTIMLAPSSKK